MKICCVISGLYAGGAERVLSLLANHWARRGWAVTIITLSPTGHDAYDLERHVERVGLGLEGETRSLWQAVASNGRKMLALRRAVGRRRPDLVISFVDRMNVLTLLACTGLQVPVVVSERTHPSYHKVGRSWSLLRRLAYRRADALVVQSNAVRVWGERLVSKDRVHIIPNPVGDQFRVADEATAERRRPVVLAVGRLGPEKGFDILIRAFRLAVADNPAWSLTIVGQGPNERQLRSMVDEHLPSASEVFPGLVKDTEPYYRTASVFVLSSRYEGFPNALLEAMASGCAVIAADCPGGTAEIVRDGIDGVLVPPDDVAALARELERLMKDSSERKRLGDAAAVSVGRFRAERILAMWDDVIGDVRGRRGE